MRIAFQSTSLFFLCKVTYPRSESFAVRCDDRFINPNLHQKITKQAAA